MSISVMVFAICQLSGDKQVIEKQGFSSTSQREKEGLRQ